MTTRLLLLPGLEGSGELFAGLVEELGPAFEAQVVRYPHNSRSYADAHAVVRELLTGNRQLVIVAESFSTPLAVQIAADRPDAAKGLVLCNGFVSSPLSELESLWALTAAPWVARFPLTSIAARTFLVGPDASDRLVADVQRAVRPLPPDVLLARLRAVLGCDAREALRRIRMPVLCLQSTRDRLVGDAATNELVRIHPDITVERMDGPHLLLQREPRRCAQRIARFVDQIVRPCTQPGN